jgi:hypothetical protein
MNRILIASGCALLISVAVKSQELSLDDVLIKYYQASAMENLQKMNTVTVTGTIVQQDLMPFRIVKVRPDKYLLEFDAVDITAYLAYDGQTAWMTAPWTGNPKPQEMPPDRKGEMKVRADFDGILYHWKDKGVTLELIGRETTDSLDAYRIKLIRVDGGTENYFIDARDFLLKKRTYMRKIRGQDVEVQMFYLDYRKQDGIPFPFVTRILTNQFAQEYQADSVEFNLPVNGNIFKMPEK